jgi:hypothetical protein
LIVKVAVSVGATMTTGIFTGVPFGATTTVVSLTETERLIGGGEKLVLPPQPTKTRIRPVAPMPMLE